MVAAAPSAAASVGVAQPRRHRADHHGEDQHQRQDVDDERPPARPAAVRRSPARARRERRIERGAQHDVADEHHAQDQPRHDAADQQPGDRDAGEAAEQHGERRRRDQHVDAADRHDRAHRHASGRSRAPAWSAASGCRAARWWRWSSRRSPRTPCRRRWRSPRAGRARGGSAARRRRSPSCATPVWNSTSPISTKNGIGVSEKLVTDCTALRASCEQPRLAAEKQQRADHVDARGTRTRPARRSPCIATRPPNRMRLASTQPMR